MHGMLRAGVAWLHTGPTGEGLLALPGLPLTSRRDGQTRASAWSVCWAGGGARLTRRGPVRVVNPMQVGPSSTVQIQGEQVIDWTGGGITRRSGRARDWAGRTSRPGR